MVGILDQDASQCGRCCVQGSQGLGPCFGNVPEFQSHVVAVTCLFLSKIGGQ